MRPLYVCHAPFTKRVLAVRVYRKGGCNCNHRVTSMPRSAFEGLELSDGKLSRSVFRGPGVSNDPRLPGFGDICEILLYHRLSIATS
jgi:hypothetical protein